MAQHVEGLPSLLACAIADWDTHNANVVLGDAYAIPSQNLASDDEKTSKSPRRSVKDKMYRVPGVPIGLKLINSRESSTRASQ